MYDILRNDTINKKHLNSDLMIQFTTTKVDISIRCKQTRNSGNCKVKRTC